MLNVQIWVCCSVAVAESRFGFSIRDGLRHMLTVSAITFARTHTHAPTEYEAKSRSAIFILGAIFLLVGLVVLAVFLAVGVINGPGMAHVKEVTMDSWIPASD